MSDGGRAHGTVEVEGVGRVEVHGPETLELARKVLDYYEKHLMEEDTDE